MCTLSPSRTHLVDTLLTFHPTPSSSFPWPSLVQQYGRVDRNRQCLSSLVYPVSHANCRFAPARAHDFLFLRAQYGTSFYLNYLARWPDLCVVQESPQRRMMGYSTRPVPRPALAHLYSPLSLSPARAQRQSLAKPRATTRSGTGTSPR